MRRRHRGHPISRYDESVAMDSEGIDNVLAKRVIPIVKTQKLPGGKYRHGNLGRHEFTLSNGKTRDLDIKTVNGSMCVKLPDGHGAPTAIPLQRAHFYWGDETKQGHTAYLKMRIPNDSGAPNRFKGATATVRLNSTDLEVHNRPHTRRTRSLRPIPEADPDFSLHGAREDIESTFSDLKYRIRDKLCSHFEDRFRFNIICYQLLRLSRTLSAYNGRSPSPQHQSERLGRPWRWPQAASARPAEPHEPPRALKHTKSITVVASAAHRIGSTGYFAQQCAQLRPSWGLRGFSKSRGQSICPLATGIPREIDLSRIRNRFFRIV